MELYKAPNKILRIAASRPTSMTVNHKTQSYEDNHFSNLET